MWWRPCVPPPWFPIPPPLCPGVPFPSGGWFSAQRPPPLLPPPPLPLLTQEPIMQYAAQIVQEAPIYSVTGREETTAYTLHLELMLWANGETMEFRGDAQGTFTASANPLQRARLRTHDVRALQERGTLFFFEFRPTGFEVRFYDPNNRSTPLGVLHADAVQPAGNPGCGAGNWSLHF